MAPVEVGTHLVIRAGAEERSDGLYKAEQDRDHARYGVSMPDGTLQLHPDENVGDHSERPGGDHEHAMPGEPLILATGLAAHPRLLEVACKDDAQRCGANPGGDHKGAMQTHQQLAGATHILNDGQIDGTARGQATNIVIADAVLLQAAARGDEHVVGAISQIKTASLHHSERFTLHLAIDDAIHQRCIKQTRRVLRLQGREFKC